MPEVLDRFCGLLFDRRARPKRVRFEERQIAEWIFERRRLDRRELARIRDVAVDVREPIRIGFTGTESVIDDHVVFGLVSGQRSRVHAARLRACCSATNAAIVFFASSRESCRRARSFVLTMTSAASHMMRMARSRSSCASIKRRIFSWISSWSSKISFTSASWCRSASSYTPRP